MSECNVIEDNVDDKAKWRIVKKTDHHVRYIAEKKDGEFRVAFQKPTLV